MLQRIADGRTDLVFDWIAQGHPALADAGGATLMEWCAYYGDVSAIRFLLSQGVSLAALGDNLGLDGAAFHGHWQLCQFLLDQGASAGLAGDTGETPLHAALSHTRAGSHAIVAILLARGADPNAATRPNMETGSFMRDCRTKGETPLHRAAAFSTPETIQLLLDRGASREARDANGDTPLGWASWYRRPDAVLRKLLYGTIRIHPDHQPMEANLLGKPHLD